MILSSIFFQRHKITGKAAAFILTAGIMTITACSADTEETRVSLSKDGTVDSIIVESFDKSYYDENELKQMILQEAASYNQQEGEGAISVKKVSVEDGVVAVKMVYADTADYAAFNDGIFYSGSVKDAQAAGYDLNKVLSSTTDSLDTVGMSDILSMTDIKILITDMKDTVVLNGKALYISSNVTVDKKLKTVSFDESSEEPAYILYK